MKSKKNQGITLIALAVTIIVMLILAGATMAMLTGNSGILTNAKKAKENTRGSDVQEEVNLAISENMMSEYSGEGKRTRAEVINKLKQENKLTEKEVETLEEQNTITIGDAKIDFSGLGSISNAKTLVQAFKDGEINVGDYITNYNSTLNDTNATVSLTSEETGFEGGTQTYKVDTNTTWRVLGLSEDETQLVITTGSPIKKEMDSALIGSAIKRESGTTENWENDPYLYLEGAEGWYNTNDELVSDNILDKICAIYAGRYATDTRSIRIEDINLALGITLDKNANKIYKTADKSKTALTSYEGCFGQSYTYKINDYAPENCLKEKYPSKYSSLINKKSGDSVEGTAFHYSYTDSSIVNQSSKLYDILFGGTIEIRASKSYWLASSGVYMDDSERCFFGPGAVVMEVVGAGYCCFFRDGLSGSNGRSEAICLAVRPIVYLQPEISVDYLSISSNGSEETWPGNYLEYADGYQDYGQITK